jgi:cell division septum initiation protein DivIVA
MKEVLSLSIDKLKQIVELKTQIARLQSKLESLAGSTSPAPIQKAVKKKRTMSAAARKKISLAAKARWAKFHAAKKSK